MWVTYVHAYRIAAAAAVHKGHFGLPCCSIVCQTCLTKAHNFFLKMVGSTFIWENILGVKVTKLRKNSKVSKSKISLKEWPRHDLTCQRPNFILLLSGLFLPKKYEEFAVSLTLMDVGISHTWDQTSMERTLKRRYKYCSTESENSSERWL